MYELHMPHQKSFCECISPEGSPSISKVGQLECKLSLKDFRFAYDLLLCTHPNHILCARKNSTCNVFYFFVSRAVLYFRTLTKNVNMDCRTYSGRIISSKFLLQRRDYESYVELYVHFFQISLTTPKYEIERTNLKHSVIFLHTSS